MIDFGFCLVVDAVVGILLGSLTLLNVVVRGELSFFTSALVLDVYLLGGFCGLVFCLNISANFIMAFNLAALMYANGYVGSGLEIESIISSSSLVSAS